MRVRERYRMKIRKEWSLPSSEEVGHTQLYPGEIQAAVRVR